tara:strand:+ start:241 stop:525 length:285 start_codon:yes stop_codon:yes gene_type:complete
MAKTLDMRLEDADCFSKRARSLALHHPDKMLNTVKVYEEIKQLSSRKQFSSDLSEAYEAVCESWYMSEELEDKKAIGLIHSEVSRVLKKAKLAS